MTAVDLAAAQEMLATAAALGEPIPVPADTPVYLGFQFLEDFFHPTWSTLTLSRETTDALTRVGVFDGLLEVGEGPWIASVPEEKFEGGEDVWPDVAQAARDWLATPGNLSTLIDPDVSVSIDRYVVRGRTPDLGSDPLADAARLLAANGVTIPGGVVQVAVFENDYSMQARVVAVCADRDTAEEVLVEAAVLASISAGYQPWLDREVWAEDKRLDYERLCAVDGSLDTLVAAGMDFVFTVCGGAAEFVDGFDVVLPYDGLPAILEVGLSDPHAKITELLAELDEASRGA